MQQTQRREGCEAFEDKILSFLSEPNLDKSVLEMSNLISSMKKQSQPSPRIPQHAWLPSSSSTPANCKEQNLHSAKSEKVREFEKRVDGLLKEIHELQTTDQANFQELIKQIKTIRKLLVQTIEQYFFNLVQSVENLELEVYQKGQELMKSKLLQLRQRAFLCQEDQLREQYEAFSLLQMEFSQYKGGLPKCVSLQQNHSAFYSIKRELQNLASLSFKETFNFIPEIISPQRNSKRGITILKNTQNRRANFVPHPETTFSWHADREMIYRCSVDNPKEVEQIKIPEESTAIPSVCTLIHSAPNDLFFVGCAQKMQTGDQLELTQRFLRFDLQQKRFENLPDLPMNNSFGQGLYFKNAIYYWGGIVDANGQKLNCKRGYKFDIEAQEWSQIASMKYPRIGGQCVSVEERIYLIGGKQNHYMGNEIIEMYDPATDRFLETLELLNKEAFQPYLNGFVVPISTSEMITIGSSYSNSHNASITLVNLYLRMTQRGLVELSKISSVNSSPPIVMGSSIYFFNHTENCVELVGLSQESCKIVRRFGA